MLVMYDNAIVRRVECGLLEFVVKPNRANLENTESRL